MRAPVNSTYVRKANRQKVLKQVYQQPGISRQDLAEEIGLTPPAISGIVKSWVSQMVIVEEGQGAPAEVDVLYAWLCVAMRLGL